MALERSATRWRFAETPLAIRNLIPSVSTARRSSCAQSLGSATRHDHREAVGGARGLRLEPSESQSDDRCRRRGGDPRAERFAPRLSSRRTGSPGAAGRLRVAEACRGTRRRRAGCWRARDAARRSRLRLVHGVSADDVRWMQGFPCSGGVRYCREMNDRVGAGEHHSAVLCVADVHHASHARVAIGEAEVPRPGKQRCHRSADRSPPHP